MERKHCLYRRIKFFKGFQTRFSHYLFFCFCFVLLFFFAPQSTLDHYQGDNLTHLILITTCYMFLAWKSLGALSWRWFPGPIWKLSLSLSVFSNKRNMWAQLYFWIKKKKKKKKKKKICKEHHQLKLKACRINAYRTVTYEFFPQALALYLLLKPWERIFRYEKFENI